MAVMAPALTDTNQAQGFKLPADGEATANGDGPVYLSHAAVCCKADDPVAKRNGTELKNALLDNTFALATELLKAHGADPLDAASDAATQATMTDCSLMGDQTDKMGLQKAGLDNVTNLLKDKTANDVDQLFNNLQDADIGPGDIGHNVDDIMQVRILLIHSRFITLFNETQARKFQ